MIYNVGEENPYVTIDKFIDSICATENQWGNA